MPNTSLNDSLIAARIDRLPHSGLHRRLVLLLAIPLFCDTVDLSSLASAAPGMTQHWGITLHTLALITSASFLGMFLGSTFGGQLCDRIGRRRSLLLLVIISSLASLASAIAPNVQTLFVTRVITGFGLAGGMITVMTYFSELFPARSRGSWQSWSMAINLFAIPITNWVARLVVPGSDAGWRWVFVFGGIGIIYPLLARNLLPESPRWDARKGRYEQAERTLSWMEERIRREGKTLPEPVAETLPPVQRVRWPALFSRLYRVRTLTLCGIWLLQTVGFYGFEAWVPTLLVQHGITISNSLTYFMLINIGAPFGALLAVLITDRFERKFLIAGVAVVIAICGLLYGLTFLPILIVTFGFMVALLLQTMASLLNSYTPEQFPTDIRSSATGFTYGFGRLANAVNAFVIAAIYAQLGYTSVFTYIAGAWLLLAVLTLVFGQRTTGRNLEKVSSA
jgi:putative MFS transporter